MLLFLGHLAQKSTTFAIYGHQPAPVPAWIKPEVQKQKRSQGAWILTHFQRLKVDYFPRELMSSDHKQQQALDKFFSCWGSVLLLLRRCSKYDDYSQELAMLSLHNVCSAALYWTARVTTSARPQIYDNFYRKLVQVAPG